MNDVNEDRPSGKDGSSWRVIVVGVIQNAAGETLICRKPKNRGVFPGQWALPGGGIEPGERMEAALRREIKEEVGIEVFDIRQLLFRDGQYPKLYPDGRREHVYMIFLVFTCRAASTAVALGEEFEAYAWLRGEQLPDYDLNLETRLTFMQMGLLPRAGEQGA